MIKTHTHVHLWDYSALTLLTVFTSTSSAVRSLINPEAVYSILQYRKLSPKEVETVDQGFGVPGPGPLVLGLPLVPSTHVTMLRDR